MTFVNKCHIQEGRAYWTFPKEYIQGTQNNISSLLFSQLDPEAHMPDPGKGLESSYWLIWSYFTEVSHADSRKPGECYFTKTKFQELWYPNCRDTPHITEQISQRMSQSKRPHKQLLGTMRDGKVEAHFTFLTTKMIWIFKTDATGKLKYYVL